MHVYAGMAAAMPLRAALAVDGRVTLDSQALKRLRQQSGLSQEALAERCLRERLCVSIASIKRAEAGRSVLYRTARHLATVYQVSMDSLIRGPASSLAAIAEAPTGTAGENLPPALACHEGGPAWDLEDEVRSVVLLKLRWLPAAATSAHDTMDRLVRQFGGAMHEAASPGSWQAVFGVPQAYLSDVARCLQCATELSRELAGQAELLVVSTCNWVGGRCNAAVRDAALSPGPSACGSPVPVFAQAGIAAQLAGHFLFGPGPEGSPWRRLLQVAHSVRGAQLPLIGRDAEIRQFKAIMEVVQVCQSGHALYARGIAGIGKTRLMSEFADMARQSGFGVHQAVVPDFGLEAGGTVLGQLARSLLGLASGADVPTAPPGADALTAGPPQAEALAALVLRKAMARPLVILIEDLHWGDAALFGALGALLAETHEAPVVWVLSSRQEGDPLDRFVQPHCAELPLTVFGMVPLRPPEAEMLALQFGNVEPGYRQRCVQRAQGNPLFLTQMLLSGEGRSVPDSLKRLVQSQLDRQAPADRRALRAAAAIGQRFPLALLREVLQSPQYQPDGPVAAHLVREAGPGVYTFVHELVMQCIYESMVSAQRDFLHKALAGCYAGRDTSLCAQHLNRARDEQAPAMFVAAIGEQLAAHRYQLALELVQQASAIRYAPRDEHTLALLGAEAAARTGRTRAADAASQAAWRQLVPN